MRAFVRCIVLLLVLGTSGIHTLFGQTVNSMSPIVLHVDGKKRFQQIDGIGVNVNTRSWDRKELPPALDLLLDSMHATIWRVIVETVEKWEDVNDNDDPFVYNWDYYNALYETPKFQKAWDLIDYLNRHGVTDKVMINFMGFAPAWMGVKVIEPKYEDEYAEMVVSFFYYGLKKRHLRFGLIAPTNESDHHKYSEGPHLEAKQHARLIRKITDRMEALGIMKNIGVVAPDCAGFDAALQSFVPALMEDAVVMSRMAHLGFHTYGGYPKNLNEFIQKSPYPKSSYWITEWNAWCNGCDESKLGEYNYDFASKSVGYLLDLLKNGASACLAWEGYDSYYEHHAPSLFSYWGMLGYDPNTKTYFPRKNFYAIQQVSRFVLPGSWQVSASEPGDSLMTVAFYHEATKRVTIAGINKRHSDVVIKGTFANLPAVAHLELYITNTNDNVRRMADVTVNGTDFRVVIPAHCLFTLTGMQRSGRSGDNGSANPEPSGWYAGDIHVHRNCGDDVLLPETKLAEMMKPNELAVISVLADMGNGEVKDSPVDLRKVNGKDAAQSQPGRLIHWDTEWHWDATYSNFNHQALGGHLVLLGLNEAHSIWEESPYKVLEWAREQKAVTGFAHFQYLNDSIQTNLNCCIPVDYPVEVALGTIDFVSEDVYGNHSSNNGTYNSEAAVGAYYKLLNCGFRPGLAAGTDYPCNENEPLGSLLTYVKVKDQLTYAGWIAGIKNGTTVVSRNGHREFLEIKVNGTYGPGDEIRRNGKGTVNVDVHWTATQPFAGTIELVSNGKVVGSKSGMAAPGAPVDWNFSLAISESGWICARRMDDRGHQAHTGAVFVTINQKPVRASVADAQYFVAWIDNILKQTEIGGAWSRYFTGDSETIKTRYRRARSIYQAIATEARRN